MAYLPHVDEQQLLPRALDGDEHAISEIVRTHQDSMLTAATRIVGCDHADDVVQEAWISAIRNLHGFRQQASLRTWLISITSNTAKSSLRKIRRHETSPPRTALARADFEGEHEPITLEPKHEESPELLLIGSELAQLLRSWVADLPEKQRHVFTLHDWQGVEITDISEIIDSSPQNARVLLCRARMKVRNLAERFQLTGVAG